MEPLDSNKSHNDHLSNGSPPAGSGQPTATTITSANASSAGTTTFTFNNTHSINNSNSNSNSPCSRTKKHLIEVGDKINSFTMECSDRLGRCSSWLCSRSHGTQSDRPGSPSADVFSGPGPSPGSSGSCDDSQPPAKNCYRLVMLG